MQTLQSRSNLDLCYLLLLPNTKKSYKQAKLLKTIFGCHGNHRQNTKVISSLLDTFGNWGQVELSLQTKNKQNEKKKIVLKGLIATIEFLTLLPDYYVYTSPPLPARFKFIQTFITGTCKFMQIYANSCNNYASLLVLFLSFLAQRVLRQSKVFFYFSSFSWPRVFFFRDVLAWSKPSWGGSMCYQKINNSK